MKEQSTSKGFAILSAASIAVKLLSIVYMPALIIIIGGNGHYAIYAVTYQIYAFIYVLTNTGIPNAISKLVSEYVAVGNYKGAIKTFKISRGLLFITSLVMSAVLFCLSGPLTKQMHYTEAKYSVIALCPAIVFTSIASAYRGYFQGRSNMKPTAISQVMEQILNTVFSLLFAAIFIRYGVKEGCVGATIGTTIGALASAIYLIIIYEKEKHYKFVDLDKDKNVIEHSNKQILKRIMKFSIPITICIGVINAGIIIDSWNITDRLIASGYVRSHALARYGIYVKYITLSNVPITIISALAMAVLPAVSSAVAVKDKNRATDKINFAFRISFLITIPAAVGFSVLAKPIYELLFLDGYRIMIYGSIIIIFSALVQIQTSILQGIGRIYAVTLYSILGLIVKYIVNYIVVGIPLLNIYGAIIGSAVGFGVPIVLNSIYIHRTLGYKINLKDYILKPLAASLLMGAVVYGIYNVQSYVLGFILKGYLNNVISSLITIAIGMYTYLYCMLIIKGITNDELNFVLSKIKRFIPNKIVVPM